MRLEAAPGTDPVRALRRLMKVAKRVEHVVQVEALPPDVLAGIIEAALRDRLDLELVGEAERLGEVVRAEAEAKLRTAGLWSVP